MGLLITNIYCKIKNMKNIYTPHEILKAKDYSQNIVLDNLGGSINVWESNNFLMGYTLGNNLPTFHPSEDSTFERSKKVLKLLGIKNYKDLLKIYPDHKDLILVNDDSLGCDGIIVTDGRPLILTPADCCGFIFLHPKLKIYGIMHTGRAGIGLELSTKFSNKFSEQVKLKGGNINDIEVYLPPHIFGYEYPHSSNEYMFTEGVPNWWNYNPEYNNEINGIYYPDIGPAAISQIREVLGLNIKITVSGLSTYQGFGYSHSILKNKMRNLIFVGMRT